MEINAIVTSILFGSTLVLFGMRLMILFFIGQLKKDPKIMQNALCAMICFIVDIITLTYFYGDNKISACQNTLSLSSTHDLIALGLLCVAIIATIVNEYIYRRNKDVDDVDDDDDDDYERNNRVQKKWARKPKK